MLDVRNKTAWLREIVYWCLALNVGSFLSQTIQAKPNAYLNMMGFDGWFNKSLCVQAHLCLWLTATSVRFTRDLLHIYLNHSLTLALVWEHCAAHLSLPQVKMVILFKWQNKETIKQTAAESKSSELRAAMPCDRQTKAFQNDEHCLWACSVIKHILTFLWRKMSVHPCKPHCYNAKA